jgi:uncharacterized protein (TIGR02246 family)
MSPQMQGTPQDEQAIRNVATEFVNAWNRNDAKGIAACFTNDGDLINPQGRIGRGRQEVERLVQEEQGGAMKGTHISLHQKNVRFLRQDLAIADYDCELERVRGADGKETTLKGLATNVVRKEGDRWLVTASRPFIPALQPGSHH